MHSHALLGQALTHSLTRAAVRRDSAARHSDRVGSPRSVARAWRAPGPSLADWPDWQQRSAAPPPGRRRRDRRAPPRPTPVRTRPAPAGPTAPPLRPPRLGPRASLAGHPPPRGPPGPAAEPPSHKRGVRGPHATLRGLRGRRHANELRDFLPFLPGASAPDHKRRDLGTDTRVAARRHFIPSACLDSLLLFTVKLDLHFWQGARRDRSVESQG